MRIGIDATAIPPNRVGAGNYIFNLVAGLASIDRDNQYFVFANPTYIAEWNISQKNFCFLPSASEIRPLRLAWEQCALPLLARQHKIDVLHSPHYTMPVFSSCRLVVTFLDMTFFLYPQLHTVLKSIFFRKMMAISACRANAIIAISESTARDLSGILRVIPYKVYTIPLAGESNYRPIANRNAIERICSRYGLLAGEYLLFVGVLEPRKNILVLLQACRDLVKYGIRKKLAIVGMKGWMYEEIFSAVRMAEMEDTVVFTGYVPKADLPYLYNGACLFVYPSLYEGFGLPVLEAIACGTPVVTSNVSSMPEIVGDSALLVDPRDPKQLTEAMERVLTDNVLNNSLRERGIQRASEFSWERTASETIHVYYQACKDIDGCSERLRCR